MASSAQSLAETVFNYPKPTDINHAIKLIEERKGAIYELADMAYRPGRDEVAWELLERGIYKINWSQTEFFGWDLVARSILNITNEVQEKYVPLLDVPSKMNAQQFTAYCKNLFAEKTTAKHPVIDYLSSGKGTPDQWRTYIQGLFARGRSFHTHIALYTLHIDFEKCMKLYKLLADEAGGGVFEKSHGMLLAKFMTDYLQMKPDLLGLAPLLGSQALWNWIVRCATHPNPAWGISNLFCMETQAFLEMKRILAGVRAKKVPDELIGFFVVHGQDEDDNNVDPEGHVGRVVSVFEQTIQTEHDQRIALTTINRNLQVYGQLFDLMWSDFKKMGL
jgi:hypothetical protein